MISLLNFTGVLLKDILFGTMSIYISQFKTQGTDSLQFKIRS